MSEREADLLQVLAESLTANVQRTVDGALAVSGVRGAKAAGIACFVIICDPRGNIASDDTIPDMEFKARMLETLASNVRVRIKNGLKR